MRGEVFFVGYNNDRCSELVVTCGRKVQLLSENTCNKLELIIYNSLKEQRIRLFNFVYQRCEKKILLKYTIKKSFAKSFVFNDLHPIFHYYKIEFVPHSYKIH